METRKIEDNKINPLSNSVHAAAKPEQKLMANAIEIKDRVQNVSSDLMRDSTQWIRKYPVTTALGAAALGFSTAMLFRRSPK
jgi:hypothetical protein